MDTNIVDERLGPTDGKKIFRKMGTCSRTFFHLLNREFGYLKEREECAVDSLAGGIMQKGYQCGMLWGASMAVGAEAYRRINNLNQAQVVAIQATQNIMASFYKRENTINCREITHCDFSSNWSFAKYMFSGRFLHCFDLAQKWAPEAVQTAMKSLNETPPDNAREFLNCASQVIKRMGGTEEEMVMVAGFAGGLGLSGSGCGALSAAIWKKSLEWCKDNNKKTSFKNPQAKEVMTRFYQENDETILCSDISGERFSNISAHITYLKNGGCAKLIATLGDL